MFADANITVPLSQALLAAPTTRPSTRPVAQAATTQPSMLSRQQAEAFQAALKPYLEAHKLLAADKSEGVAKALLESSSKLTALQPNPAIDAALARIVAALKDIESQDLERLRQTFREISVAMIEIGKSAGVPDDGPNIQVFRCPMKDKPYWLQAEPVTSNPYYGSQMPTCGAAVEPLPMVAAPVAPTTRPAIADGQVLAVPRSAVIDTGRHKIVYVQAQGMEGVFDMRAVKLGPLAGDYYPVTAGLKPGERVVTVGAFLVDAENRLNPAEGTTNEHR